MKYNIKGSLALFCACGLILTLSGTSFAAAKKAPAKKSVPAPAPVVETVAAPTAASPAQPGKAGWFAEGGLAGGAAAVELGYGKSLGGALGVSGAVGYALGNKYGVVVVDLARLTYNAGGMFFGAGLNYAMYSDIIKDIPGISGNISNKNLAGLEVFAGKKFGKYSGRIAYSTALGLRAGVGYDL